MKLPFRAILTAICLSGCSRSDPIARLIAKVSDENVPSYPFKMIELPETATPDQLISALSKRRSMELGHFDFTDYKILKVRSVQARPPLAFKYIAVLLDTNLGRRIVLFQPRDYSDGWRGWYYRTYEAK